MTWAWVRTRPTGAEPDPRDSGRHCHPTASPRPSPCPGAVTTPPQSLGEDRRPRPRSQSRVPGQELAGQQTPAPSPTTTRGLPLVLDGKLVPGQGHRQVEPSVGILGGPLKAQAIPQDLGNNRGQQTAADKEYVTGEAASPKANSTTPRGRTPTRPPGPQPACRRDQGRPAILKDRAWVGDGRGRALKYGL